MTPTGTEHEGIAEPSRELVRTIRARLALPAPSERRAIRKRTGATQAELAAELGCSVQAIALWEKGLRTPTPRFLVPYSELLLRLSDLVEEVPTDEAA